MKIYIKDLSATYTLDDDCALDEPWIFRCNHDNAVVEKPCCDGNNCDCHGMTSVYCPDCGGEDLTDEQVEEMTFLDYLEED